MNYCLVENNIIVDGPRGLPKSWRNISGLDLLDKQSLRLLGWLPLRLEEGIVDDVYAGSVFAILADEVVETKLWHKYTDEQRAEIERQKAEGIRQERNTLLTNCDWTQLNDTPLDNPTKVEWTTYRQALRDIPTQSGFPHSVV